VATAQRSKYGIVYYKTVKGDTIPKLSDKFHVSTNSIRWSNDITGDALAKGVKLVIPPVNGIVYRVKSGDTPASLATKYSSDERQIIVYNDAEVKGLRAGELIVIPNGEEQPTYQVQATDSYFTANYGGNGYAYGFCTWYVASVLPVPSNWGNANTWDNYAGQSGWVVSIVPRVGAIAQSDGGWAGHVAVVTAVSANGQKVKYSDMNGLSGWGRVGTSGWVPVTNFNHYIYR
jgi:surface antigen